MAITFSGDMSTLTVRLPNVQGAAILYNLKKSELFISVQIPQRAVLPLLNLVPQ
jgi:hypothetical protein